MSTLIIITGASRGIGRAIAVAFAKESRIKNPAFCLIARNKDALSQTESLIKREIEDGNNCNNEGGREKQVRSSSHSIDLSKLDTLANEIKSVFRQQIEGDTNVDGNGNGNGNVITDPVHVYERAILINNAGSLGHVGSSSDLPSPQELQANVDFNVTSTIWLSSYFVKYFAHEHQIKCNVVNISSLCAITPFKTMAMYCAGKAARDMWHKTLGLEQEDGTPSVKVLNYAPGAIETDMTKILSNSSTLDPELSTYYKSMSPNGDEPESKSASESESESESSNTLIRPSATAERLVNLVLSDEYRSGDHIDYWDLETADQ